MTLRKVFLGTPEWNVFLAALRIKSWSRGQARHPLPEDVVDILPLTHYGNCPIVSFQKVSSWYSGLNCPEDPFIKGFRGPGTHSSAGA